MGGYPFLDALPGDRLAEDSDGDGLPDSYETAEGLDPNNPDDGNALAPSGYTHLEEWLNGVADGRINKADYETLPYSSVQPVSQGLGNLDAEAVSPRYIYFDGQLLIEKKGEKFTLSGQKMQ